jgi:hypothetical protein
MSNKLRHPFRTDNAASGLPWKELPTTAEMERSMINAANSYLRRYMLGECSVIVTKEFGEWHLSIAHPSRYPTWDEVAQARYRATPKDVWMALMLPPPEHYVNIHERCFQLVQVEEPKDSI